MTRSRQTLVCRLRRITFTFQSNVPEKSLPHGLREAANRRYASCGAYADVHRRCSDISRDSPCAYFYLVRWLGQQFHKSLDARFARILWFATRDGLSRFDGIRFVTYQVGKKDAPPGIEHAFETSKGIYWIVTTGGLYRYDPNSLPVKAQDNNIGRPTLNAEYINGWRGPLYEDNVGRIWFVGYGGLRCARGKRGPSSFSRG